MDSFLLLRRLVAAIVFKGQTVSDYWWSRRTIFLTNRDTLLGWIQGASVYDFVDSRAQGTFQGRQYSSPDLTSVHLPNRVPTEHCSWVTTEVEQLVSTGCITRWADVADTSLYTKPHTVLPLGVGPKEPRPIWDARWFHRRRVHSPLYHGWRGKSSSVRVTRGSPGDNRS